MTLIVEKCEASTKGVVTQITTFIPNEVRSASCDTTITPSCQLKIESSHCEIAMATFWFHKLENKKPFQKFSNCPFI